MDKALEQFMAVTEAGSFMAAAERLMVSQPALTYNLKKLETSLGVRLFDRTSRGVQLTRYGETLYKNTQMMRRLYDNALTTIERQRAEAEERLSIGTGYSTWLLFLKDFVTERLRANPRAPINVSIATAMRCMEQLWAGDISLFIGHRIPNLVREVEVDFIPLGTVRDGCFVRKDHPLLGAQRSLNEIFAFPTTSLAFPPDLRQKRLLEPVDRQYLQNNTMSLHQIGAAFTSNSLEACLDIAKSTDTVLIHSRLLAREFAQNGLSEVEILNEQEFEQNILGIYTLHDTDTDPALSELISRIQERAKGLDLHPL